jgi:hypothetical protein
MTPLDKIEEISQLLMSLHDDGVYWGVQIKGGSGKQFIRFYGEPLDHPVRLSDLGGYA